MEELRGNEFYDQLHGWIMQYEYELSLLSCILKFIKIGN